MTTAKAKTNGTAATTSRKAKTKTPPAVRKAALALSRAIDRIAELDPECNRLASSGDSAATEAFWRDVWHPAETELYRADKALSGALTDAGLGGVIVAGRLFVATVASELSTASVCLEHIVSLDPASVVGLS